MNRNYFFLIFRWKDERHCRNIQNFLYVFWDNGKELEDYFILLIPNAFLNQKDTVHVSKSGAWFNNFQVSKEELKGILDMYAETLNMSKERTD